MVEQEAGKKIDDIDSNSEKEIRIWECHVFDQYLTVHIVLRQKDKSYYCFPLVVTNNAEEGSKHLKLRNEKRLTQICKKNWTERKLEKTRNNKIMISASLSYPHQSLQHQNWKANTYLLPQDWKNRILPTILPTLLNNNKSL